jgi:serine/threonine protein kinase/tetratricopeptide (TPR) repeat protein
LDGNSDVCPVCALKNALESENHATATELRFEHYQILKNEDQSLMELGHGSMGVTYKALDVQLQRPVALKIINAKFIGDASARQRFVREARAAASVRHPNVATVYHLGEIGGDYFYAMEFVEGETLANVIHHAGRINTDLALEITAQVAAGLNTIHKQHLVHRDIKPGNIMVDLKDGQIESVKIIDLGLAKGVAEEGSISAAGSFAGTPGYASPEQFAGVGVDIRSDLYSLGIVLWEMLTGSLPFHGTNSELLSQHQHASLPTDQLARAPKQVVPLLEILLEKDPALRFQTPNDLLKALAIVNDAIDSGHWLTKSELRSKAVGAVLQKGSAVLSPAQRKKQRHVLVWVALIPGVAALFTGLLLFFNRAPHDTVTLAEKGVAVLPFDNLSANKDDGYFADGVQDEILNNLAKIAQLKVISRTSVMQYRADTKRDLRQIAGALGVANVLEGTVRRNGNHVRVSTELIDARNDHTIWADSYDRDLTDIFAIQSDVAQTIAGKLTAALSPEEKKQIEARPTANLQAYDLYLRAKETMANIRANWWAVGDVEAKLREGVSLLEQAIQLDSKFTLAYALAAEYHGVLYFNPFDPTPRRRALAEAAINNALALEPDLPEVHRSYAHYLICCNWDYDGAQAQLAIARRGLPNDTEVIWLGADVDMRQGHFEKAIQQLNEAITHDPLNAELLRTLGRRLFATHRFRAGEQVLRRLIEMFPNQPSYKLDLAWGMVTGTGDVVALSSAIAALPASVAEEGFVLSSRLGYAFAIRDWRQVAQLLDKMRGREADDFSYVQAPVPVGCYSILLARLQGENVEGNSGFAQTREQLNQKVLKSGENPSVLPAELSNLAFVDALLGHKQLAIQEAKHASEMEPISKDAIEGPGLLENLAVVYAWSGELDLAFETLSHLRGTPFGLFYGDLKLDPDWEPLRQDPRYSKLLAEIAPKD